MITNKWGRVVHLLCIMMIGLLVACGEDDKKETNNSDGKTDTGVSQDVDESAEPGVIEQYRSDYQLRFTSFKFTADPGTLLNGILKKNFDQNKTYPVVILIEMKDLDISKQSVGVRGGSGLKTETAGTYNWDAETDLQELAPGELKADGSLNVTLPKLDFIATFEDKGTPLKTLIPIQGLKLTGHLLGQPDGSDPVINDGVLEGYVTAEDGDNTEILIPGSASTVTLSSFFNKDALNYDVDKDGTNDAWLLKAAFTAVETKIVD